ncbi:hypothetical protein BDB01DRAFT_836052 [Pilobolus umbonatus]|nr:hypothetical protein BDB01DRAFT_836052 [Pilobolus umbonatus]
MSSSSSNMELNEFNIPDFLLSFQGTLRDNEEKFKQYDGFSLPEIVFKKNLSKPELKLQPLIFVTSSGTDDSTHASHTAAYVPQKPHSRNKSGVTCNRQAIARHFYPPSNDQGLTYLYIPCRSGSRHNETHICYPTSGRIGILVHNDYIEGATSILTKFSISLIADFDPKASKIVKDPKFRLFSDADRKSVAEDIHHTRLLKVFVLKLFGPFSCCSLVYAGLLGTEFSTIT